MAGKSIEDVIGSVLGGEARENALDFVAHLRAHGITPGESEPYWEIKHRDQCVCFIWIDGADAQPGPWTIWSNQEPGGWAFWGEGEAPEAATVDADIRETAWAHVNFCADCGGDCSPGRKKTILGKEFDHVCGSALAFTNPDAAALACAKRMVDARIDEILGAMP